MTGAGDELRSAPGEFRNVQAYITGGGEVIYTPPAPDRMPGCLDDLFRYIAGPPDAPPLVEIAWVHYAFEAIHPFRDGNGRVGRILMPLLLARRRGLEHPLLYLSPYLFEHRQEYYDRLFAVSARSDWAGWLAFMLRAVASRAQTSVATAQRLIAIEDEWRLRLEGAGATPTALRLASLIRRQSLAVTAPHALGLLAGAGSPVTPPTAYQAIRRPRADGHRQRDHRPGPRPHLAGPRVGGPARRRRGQRGLGDGAQPSGRRGCRISCKGRT